MTAAHYAGRGSVRDLSDARLYPGFDVIVALG